MIDVPYNITAVTGDILEGRQIFDNADLMRTVPGVAIVDRGYRNSGVINGIMIRGVNSDGSAYGDYQLSTVPTVSTYPTDARLRELPAEGHRAGRSAAQSARHATAGLLGGTARHRARPATRPVLRQRLRHRSESERLDDVATARRSRQHSVRRNRGVAHHRLAADYGTHRLRESLLPDANGIPVAPDLKSDDAEYYVKKDADTVRPIRRAALACT